MENTMDRDFILKRIADLLFEVGMLKKRPPGRVINSLVQVQKV